MTTDKEVPSSATAHPDVASEAPRTRGWVRREIAALDPEVDYERIVQLMANYQFTEFPVNFGYVIGFHYNVIPSPGSEAIVGTGEAEQRPQTRFFDTARYLFGWQFQGLSDPTTLESIERVNMMHDHLAKRFPASFEKNEDFIFPLVVLMTQGDRMREIAGAPRLTRNQQIALHHFWRDVSLRMRGSHGPLVDFPASYEEAERFAEEFESRNWPQTPNGRTVSELFIDQFNTKYLPRFMHPLGRAAVLTFVTEQVRNRHQLAPVSPILMALTKLIFRTLFFLGDHAPEPKIPLSEVFASDKFQERYKQTRTAESAARPPRERPAES